MAEPEILTTARVGTHAPGSPDRIYYRFLVGTAERDRRPCPEGTGFARGRGISELDRRSRKSVVLDAEPRVRIHLPPAGSLQTFGPSRATPAARHTRSGVTGISI